jgi:hypothetical protein
MKLIFLITILTIFLDATCKNKKTASIDTIKPDTVQAAGNDTAKKQIPSQPAKTKGKVSHRYAANGCPTIVIVNPGGAEELILIPRTALEKKFNVDGREIYFNYHLLKIPQPPGCEKGMPADIIDISSE